MARFKSRSWLRAHVRSRSKRRIHEATAVNTEFHFPHAPRGPEPSRMSHVILLTDAHEAPAYELIEALRAAGVKTLIEGLREVEVEVELAKERTREGVEEAESESQHAVRE